MLTSAIFSAIVLASGSMAQYYGGGSSQSSSTPKATSTTAANAVAPNTWSSSTPKATSTTVANAVATNTWSSSMPKATSTTAANAVATNTWSSWPASSTKPGTVMVQVVEVSNKNGSSLRYYPEKVQAPPGSWVQFQFLPKNHTVTQSTFGNPCVPIHSIMSNVTGIKSGFMPVAANASAIPVFSILINDTTPIWLYCGQTGHCQQGMSMVINENAASNKTLEVYKAAAAMLSSNMTMTSRTLMSSNMPMTTSSMMMMSTTIPTMVPTTTKASPATFSGAASREAVGSSGLAGLLFAGLAFFL